MRSSLLVSDPARQSVAQLPVILLAGPTASGKSALAMHLCARFPFEIVSVDSAQIYCQMNIGTAKPGAGTLAQIPHHLIDIIEPTERYSAARFCTDANRAIAHIHSRGRIPLLTGGTMLYFKALREGLSMLPEADADVRTMLDEMAAQAGWSAMHEKLRRIDPETADRIEPGDAQRIQRALEVFHLTGQPLSSLMGKGRASAVQYRYIAIAIEPSVRSVLHARVAARFDAMLELGLIAEVRSLRGNFALNAAHPSMRCVGYRQVWQYLDGDLTAHDLRERGIAATRQLVKRQLTWLRAWTDVRRFDCLTDDLHARVGDFLTGALAPAELESPPT
ncbi:MAG: tRNA (adenosine(37)-N6)-dimethylallyltransferase MiaA [Betaproteobacteria bacterium]